MLICQNALSEKLVCSFGPQSCISSRSQDPGLRLRVRRRLHWLAACLTLIALMGSGGSVFGEGLQSSPAASSGHSEPNPFWTAPKVGQTGSLGKVSVSVKGHGVVDMYPTVAGIHGAFVVKGSKWSSDNSTLTITFEAGSSDLHINVHVFSTSAGMRAVLDADQPEIANVDMGRWPPALKVHRIAVPYYSPGVWYSPSTSTYMSLWWDWHTTNATKVLDTAAVYEAKTDGSFNLMHEELNLAASPDVDAVFPYPGNPTSPYITKLAGRMVVDMWDYQFNSAGQSLQHLADHGIGNCVAIIHNWQHLGYDNGLPEHFPANPKLGGDAALKSAVSVGTADGCLVALHENYEDYYPNFPKFNPAAIALKSDGGRVNSWLNIGTKTQSFLTKPGLMLTYAEAQSPLIHAQLGTSAAYLDEHSALRVSVHVDMDAKDAGGGKLTTLLKANQALWAYERKTHGGPVFGEGGAHWYYSGLLDGVEAQQETGYALANAGESLPLFVDFDLTRLHPLEVDQGMGYYERWSKDRTSSMTPLQLDAYRMQEVAFGHAPFLSKGTVGNISEALLESSLVSPVAKRYGVSQAASILYKIDGKWAGASVAAAAGKFNQVEIKYKNGLVVLANSAPEPLEWEGIKIPQYGWAAKDGDLLAYTAMCNSTICDYAQTSNSLFANARHSADSGPGLGFAKASVVSVKAEGDHRFAIAYDWKVFGSPQSTGRYVPFVHFMSQNKTSGPGGALAFQDVHPPQLPVADWKPGQAITAGPWVVSVPSSVPDGNYSIRVGIYDPGTGDRLTLSGKDDGSKRYLIGDLTISGHGSQFSFTPPAEAVIDGSRMNSSDAVVDFGKVQTDGMISMTRQNGEWVLRPYPTDRNFTVMLNARDFPMPASIQGSGPGQSAITPVSKGSYWTFPMSHANYYSWTQTN